MVQTDTVLIPILFFPLEPSYALFMHRADAEFTWNIYLFRLSVQVQSRESVRSHAKY